MCSWFCCGLRWNNPHWGARWCSFEAVLKESLHFPFITKRQKQGSIFFDQHLRFTPVVIFGRRVNGLAIHLELGFGRDASDTLFGRRADVRYWSSFSRRWWGQCRKWCFKHWVFGSLFCQSYIFGMGWNHQNFGQQSCFLGFQSSVASLHGALKVDSLWWISQSQRTITKLSNCEALSHNIHLWRSSHPPEENGAGGGDRLLELHRVMDGKLKLMFHPSH